MIENKSGSFRTSSLTKALTLDAELVKSRAAVYTWKTWRQTVTILVIITLHQLKVVCHGLTVILFSWFFLTLFLQNLSQVPFFLWLDRRTFFTSAFIVPHTVSTRTPTCCSKQPPEVLNYSSRCVKADSDYSWVSVFFSTWEYVVMTRANNTV